MPFLFHWKKRIHQKKKSFIFSQYHSNLTSICKRIQISSLLFLRMYCSAHACKVYPPLTNRISFRCHRSDNCSPLLYYLKYIYNHWYLNKLKSLPSSWRWVGILSAFDLSPSKYSSTCQVKSISFTHNNSWKEHFKLGDVNFTETLLLQLKLRNIE